MKMLIMRGKTLTSQGSTLFKNLAEMVLDSHKGKIATACCPDQYVAKSSDFGNFRKGEKFRFRREKIPKTGSRIFLILESPHTEEFKHDLPGPAMGKTGESIRNYFHAYFRASVLSAILIPRMVYSFVLVNAIQYQCSLGVAPSSFRDRVFSEFWNKVGKADFIARLKRYYKSGDIVINACTKGNLKNCSLKSLVEKAIIMATDKNSALQIPHPADPRFKTRANELLERKGIDGS